MQIELHVVPIGPPNALRRWGLELNGRVIPRTVFRSQAITIKRGRTLAEKHRFELVIHGRDGRIRAKDSHGRESNRKG